MVANDAVGNMLPAMIIAKGRTHTTLDKFLIHMTGSFTTRSGGALKDPNNPHAKTRYTNIDGDLKKKLAPFPPYYRDEKSGHVLCSGGHSHWMNASTLRLWIQAVVWSSHVRACKADNLDPNDAYCILHFDAYPVHISAEFLGWLEANYKQIKLAYVPANCTSVLQFADVVLNRPLKAAFTKQHMGFLIADYRRQIARGTNPSDVAFSDVVSKAAGRSLKWLLSAYSGLQSLDMKGGLDKLRYPRCFVDNKYRFEAVSAWDRLFESKEPSASEISEMLQKCSHCPHEDMIVIDAEVIDGYEADLIHFVEG